MSKIVGALPSRQALFALPFFDHFRWTRWTSSVKNILKTCYQKLKNAISGILSKAIPLKCPLKLFLDMVPSSFAHVTRVLRGCFRGGSVYALFRFKAKVNLQRCRITFLIFWWQAKELRQSLCFNTFRNFNRSLNKRQTVHYTTQTKLNKRQRNVQTNECKASKRSNTTRPNCPKCKVARNTFHFAKRVLQILF